MKKKYPRTVCLDCLEEAQLDSKKYHNKDLEWSEFFASYTHTCEVCGLTKECTEPSDAGYPTFDYVYLRLRTKKIKKILGNEMV